MLITMRFLYLHLSETTTFFHQAGAAAHYSHHVRIYLDSKSPENWISRRGVVEWPARSPDLTPYDFFLWGNLKEKLINTPDDSIEYLTSRIGPKCKRVRPTVSRKVRDNAKLRLNVLENYGCGHFENLIQQ